MAYHHGLREVNGLTPKRPCLAATPMLLLLNPELINKLTLLRLLRMLLASIELLHVSRWSSHQRLFLSQEGRGSYFAIYTR
jgi:hypothetical protein